jgi:hypothetical protein
MNCQNCRDRMPELFDESLDANTSAELRAHIESCPDCTLEYVSIASTLRALDSIPAEAPWHRLRANVRGMIETEKLSQEGQVDWASSIRSSKVPRRHSFPWFRTLVQGLGVCALVALGFIFGERAATQRQLADLRARVDTVGQLVEQSVLQKRPASDRMETILTAATIQKPDERVIDGLINSMAFDPSVNVRLNALNTLYAHSDQEVVRAGVLACLPKETNALVQVSMIDFLVGSKAREAKPELMKLELDDKADTDVRDSARRAVDLL